MRPLIPALAIISLISHCVCLSERVEEALANNRKRVYDSRNSFRERLGLSTVTTTTATTTTTTAATPEDDYYWQPEQTNSTEGAMEELKNFNAKNLYQVLG